DVGQIVMPELPPHRFVLPDGAPLESGTVHLLRAGWNDVDHGWKFEPDENGHVWLPELLPGDALLVRAPRPEPDALDGASVVDLPSRFVIGDDVPATFRMHGGELRVDVDAGDARAYATFGDRVVPLRGATVVRGLVPDDYTVWLGAAGRRSAAVDVLVTAPEDAAARRRLSVALPPR
ncbi:MAG: hypothetical protein KAI24_04915, partial [Planctomycetes bacterium]|nr:hypothetical protein [Planctomycetota bacterium]